MEPSLFQKAFEFSKDCVLITDANLQFPGPFILYVNPAFCKMTGYESYELVGQTPRILQGRKTNRQILIELKETLLKGEVFSASTVNYTKTSKEYQVDWTISPVVNSSGEITHFISFQRDVSEKLQREREINRRLRFEMGVASSTQALVSSDTSYTNLSQSLLQMLLFTEFDSVFLLEQRQTKSYRDWNLIFTATTRKDTSIIQTDTILSLGDKPGIERWASELLEGNPVLGFRGDFPIEEQWFFDRGVEFLILFPIFIRDHFTYILGWENHFALDSITDADNLLFRTVTHWVEAFLNRKQDLEELKKHRDDLASIVEAQVNDLKLAKEQAESANRLKSEFLAKMSHELRTPLNSILGFSKLIQLPEQDMENRKLLDYIHNSGLHLLKMINEILDLSKIEAGKMDVFLQETDLLSVVEAVIYSLTPQIQKKQLSLEYSLNPGEVGILWADPKKLQQVLLNLLSNAVKFSPLSGKIQILWSADMDSVRVEIRDEGPGVLPEHQNFLFQNFSQAPKNQNPYAEEGTGLGLVISRGLMELQGGKVFFVPTESGACFSVQVPLKKKDARPVNSFVN